MAAGVQKIKELKDSLVALKATIKEDVKKVKLEQKAILTKKIEKMDSIKKSILNQFWI
ncbi:hypothetical protein SCLARK_001836 [Spiroplasma clarkii]|uniref:hypothetical protein n=1 Tax=Spiroplasma clarkii TaxID=2139 RepID=UPI000B54FEFD|nr:hypothetical protein [Spiroplasma clarkii]ARU92279.1 hypothetical protein SCLARK_001836 [Spiroplasma clarkii]